MRVLIVTGVYPPEIGSQSQLMMELAQDLSRRGHLVTVLTSWPAYKLAEGTDGDTFSEFMMEGGIRVLRTRTLPIHKSNFIVRGVAQLLAPVQFWRTLKRHEAKAFDGVLVYSPPLPLALVGAWARRAGARFVLNVQDLFPQNAIDLGILTNPVLVAFYRWIERRAYTAANVVTAHSESNRTMLASANPGIADKLVVLHNWIDVALTADPSMVAKLRREFDLGARFVAVYGGVIGPAQGLDVALDLAARVRDLNDLVFLIVGDGTEKPRLEARVKAEGLSNVVFRPFVPSEAYPALLGISDIGFVTLSAKMKTPVVPGKILGYMVMSLPVFAMINRESDAHALIRDANCGYSCNSDDLTVGEALIRKMYGEREGLVRLGANGRAYAEANFSKPKIIDQIEAMLAPQPARPGG